MQNPSSACPAAELRCVLKQGSYLVNQSSILQHWLRQTTLPLLSPTASYNLRDAIIVGLDAEWYEHDPSYITELGVAIIDPRYPNDRTSPWKLLQSMITRHVRIAANAHLINSDLCSGCPDKFQAGTTTYSSITRAKDLLRSTFVRPDARGYFRPVIFIGHAVDNDARMLKERFDFDIQALGVVIATIDTQVMAAEQGVVPSSRKARLRDLLSKQGIIEDYLHNAGNDIVCTLITALLMLWPWPITDNLKAYDELKKHLQAKLIPLYGSKVYCIKCGSTTHTVADCSLAVTCTYCMADPDHRDEARTHKTEKCRHVIKDAAVGLLQDVQTASPHFKPLHAIPCAFCIESPDPERHCSNYAYNHLEKDCNFTSKN